MATPNQPESDIEVTTATRSVEEVNASLAAAAPKPAEAKAPTAAEIKTASDSAIVEDAAATGLDPEVLKAINDLEPPPDKKIETVPERRARISRSTKRVLGEIAKRKTAETERDDARTKLDAADKRIAELTAGKPADGTAAVKAAPNADGKPATATTEFNFPSWEKWQEEHPDDDFTAYSDARTDARYQYNESLKTKKLETEDIDKRTKLAFDDASAGEQEVRAEFPDYDEVTSKIVLATIEVQENGKTVIKPAPGTVALQGELLRMGGKKGAAFNRFLGLNPADAKALMEAPTPADFLRLFGQLEYRFAQAPAAPAGDGKPAADAAATIPAKTAPAKEHKPAAPAPLAPVRGAHSPTKTAADISEDDGDDADAYIAKRRAELASA